MFGNGTRKGGSGKEEDEEKPVEKFLVKWSGMSYLHVSWETFEELLENGGKIINMKVLDGSCSFIYFSQKRVRGINHRWHRNLCEVKSCPF